MIIYHQSEKKEKEEREEREDQGGEVFSYVYNKI